MLNGTEAGFRRGVEGAVRRRGAGAHRKRNSPAVLTQLDRRLPGAGSLQRALRGVPQPFRDPAGPARRHVPGRASTAAARARSSTSSCRRARRFTVEYVTGKSWSGYNWYQGNYRSLIQVNTDLPIFIDRAIDLACHEGYPGHHVYNVLLEKHLVRDRGWQEFTVYPLFSPQSLIAEGTANYGIEVAFPRAERREFERRRAVPGRRPRSGPRSTSTTTCRSWSTGCPTPERSGAAVSRTATSMRAAAAAWLERYALSARARAAAARPVLRPVPQLRDQLQPRQGHGGAPHRARRPATPPTQRWGRRSRQLLSSPRLPSGLRHSMRIAATSLDSALIASRFAPGGPEVLRPAERPDPVPAAGEVLIDVAAAGVNRPDVMQRQGSIRRRPAPATCPGSKWPARSRLSARRSRRGGPAMRVCALVAGGGYADAVRRAGAAVPAGPARRGHDRRRGGSRKPFSPSGRTCSTADGWRQGSPRSFMAAPSGIGTTAIQLAAARGARVFATAGSDDKCRAVRTAWRGAWHQLPHRDFVEAFAS